MLTARWPTTADHKCVRRVPGPVLNGCAVTLSKSVARPRLLINQFLARVLSFFLTHLFARFWRTVCKPRVENCGAIQ